MSLLYEEANNGSRGAKFGWVLPIKAKGLEARYFAVFSGSL